MFLGRTNKPNSPRCWAGKPPASFLWSRPVWTLQQCHLMEPRLLVPGPTCELRLFGPWSNVWTLSRVFFPEKALFISPTFKGVSLPSLAARSPMITASALTFYRLHFSQITYWPTPQISHQTSPEFRTEHLLHLQCLRPPLDLVLVIFFLSFTQIVQIQSILHLWHRGFLLYETVLIFPLENKLAL